MQIICCLIIRDSNEHEKITICSWCMYSIHHVHFEGNEFVLLDRAHYLEIVQVFHLALLIC